MRVYLDTDWSVSLQGEIGPYWGIGPLHIFGVSDAIKNQAVFSSVIETEYEQVESINYINAPSFPWPPTVFPDIDPDSYSKTFATNVDRGSEGFSYGIKSPNTYTASFRMVKSSNGSGVNTFFISSQETPFYLRTYKGTIVQDFRDVASSIKIDLSKNNKVTTSVEETHSPLFYDEVAIQFLSTTFTDTVIFSGNILGSDAKYSVAIARTPTADVEPAGFVKSATYDATLDETTVVFTNTRTYNTEEHTFFFVSRDQLSSSVASGPVDLDATSVIDIKMRSRILELASNTEPFINKPYSGDSEPPVSNLFNFETDWGWTQTNQFRFFTADNATDLDSVKASVTTLQGTPATSHAMWPVSLTGLGYTWDELVTATTGDVAEVIGIAFSAEQAMNTGLPVPTDWASLPNGKTFDLIDAQYESQSFDSNGISDAFHNLRSDTTDPPQGTWWMINGGATPDVAPSEGEFFEVFS